MRWVPAAEGTAGWRHAGAVDRRGLERAAGGVRRGCHGTAATAAGRGGVVPLEGDLGERPGRSPRTSVPVPPAVAGERSRGWRRRLVEPGDAAAAASRRVRRPSPRPRGRARCRRAPARASRDDLQAEGLGRTARLARRPASRRGSRAHRHRRSRRCAGRRVGGHIHTSTHRRLIPPSRTSAGWLMRWRIRRGT